jgi:hypothetical protein
MHRELVEIGIDHVLTVQTDVDGVRPDESLVEQPPGKNLEAVLFLREISRNSRSRFNMSPKLAIATAAEIVQLVAPHRSGQRQIIGEGPAFVKQTQDELNQ